MENNEPDNHILTKSEETDYRNWVIGKEVYINTSGWWLDDFGTPGYL